MDFKCVGDVDGKFARVDFMVTTASGHLVALEVDEEQHRFGYGSIGCDMKRMTKIYESLAIEGNSQLTFLRYNPDTYKVAGTGRGAGAAGLRRRHLSSSRSSRHLRTPRPSTPFVFSARS